MAWKHFFNIFKVSSLISRNFCIIVLIITFTLKLSGRGGGGRTPRGGRGGGMKIDFKSPGTGANKRKSFGDD